MLIHKIINTFGVSHREWPRLFTMGILLFLLMLGWGFGLASRDAFFIKSVGPDKLPIVFMINSILIVILSNYYFQIVDRLPRYQLFVILLAVFGGGLLVLRLMIPLHLFWIPYAIYFFSESILNVVILMHFWTVANSIFDPREGKRIFPIIGGAGLSGLIIGGALTHSIVSVIGTENIFLLWSGILFGLIPIIFLVKHIISPSDYNKPARIFRRKKNLQAVPQCPKSGTFP